MRTIIIILACMLLIPSSSALYADLSFEVGSDGLVTIDGVTNIPELEPGVYDSFTSKTGSLWLVNITTAAPVQTFVYTVRLPEGSQVNYVAGKGARITTDNGFVVVQGSGSDSPLSIVIQYENHPQSSPLGFAWLPLVGMSVLLFGLWMVVYKRAGKAKKSEQTSVQTPALPKYIDGIPERQQAMVTLLRKAGGTLTQRQLELALKLPKSSISRNVEGLRRRGIIEKAQLGMTNTVVLAQQYR